MIKKCIYLLTKHNKALSEIGLLTLRVSIGLIFMKHGFPKLFGGPAVWANLGSAMNSIGISLFPSFWGFCAAFTEALGGCLLVLGLGTRLSALLLAIVMKIALIMHIRQGADWNTCSYPLSMLMVMISIIIAGGGFWSLDTYLSEQK